MSRTGRTVGLGAAVAVTAVLLTGCGGSSSGAGGAKVSADTWVGKVCQNVSTYTTVASNTPDLTSSLGAGDYAGTQKKMSAYLAALSKASSTLADDIGKDGTPDVDKGSQVVTAIQSSLRTLAITYDQQKQKIDAADPSNRTAFTAALTAVGKSISAASKQVGKSLDSVTGGGNSALEKAYNSSATCKKLDTSSGS